MDTGGKLVDVPVSSAVGKDNVRSETALATNELKDKTLSIVQQAKAITITTYEQSMSAADFLKGIKALKKMVEEKLSPLVKAAYDSWKKQVAFKKEHDDPLNDAEAVVKAKMNTYLFELERKRQEEETRRQAEAQKAAEAQAEQDALLMEATGDEEAAEAVRAAPVVAPVVAIAPVEKPQGITTQDAWLFRVTDSSKIPLEYMEPNLKAIGAVVRALKEATKIPGIVVYSEKRMSVRSS